MSGRVYTQSEIDFIRTNYGKLTHRQIADKLGRPRRSVSVMMCRLGLNYKPHTALVILDAEQIGWLRRHFPECRNSLCAAHLGISESTLHRIARQMKLKKTPEFVSQCQQYSLNRAHISNRENGTYPPKGVVNANIAKGAPYRFKPKQAV